MSVHVSSWAWKQKLGDPGLKLVLIKLADNADQEGYSFWRQKRLAEECEMSRPTVQRKLAKLVSLGLLAVIERERSDGGQGANGYRLLPPHQSEAGGAPHDAEAGSPHSSEAPKEPSDNQQQSLEPSPRLQIQAAWLEAPGLIRHRHSFFAEPVVRKAMDKAVKLYGVEDVVKAIQSYAEVLESPAHFFKHSWTLTDFLTRGLDRFVPEAEPRRVFLTSGSNVRGAGEHTGETDVDDYTRA